MGQGELLVRGWSPQVGSPSRPLLPKPTNYEVGPTGRALALQNRGARRYEQNRAGGSGQRGKPTEAKQMFGKRRPLRLVLIVLSVLLVSSLASAMGRVVWKKTKLAESSESWRLDLEFHMNKPPDIAHVPMKFEFEPLTYFERSLEDGQTEPQVRRVPLDNKSKLIETVLIGFLDPGTGQTQSRTRFSFKLTRERGFEAGEYNVKIKDKRTDAVVGSVQRITLDGENEVVDRRSISFDPSKKKPKKDEAASEPQYDPKADPNNDEYWAGGPTEAESQEDKTLPPPAHLQEKPGSCSVQGGGSKSGGAWGLLLLGLVALSRRAIRRG